MLPVAVVAVSLLRGGAIVLLLLLLWRVGGLAAVWVIALVVVTAVALLLWGLIRRIRGSAIGTLLARWLAVDAQKNVLQLRGCAHLLRGIATVALAVLVVRLLLLTILRLLRWIVVVLIVAVLLAVGAVPTVIIMATHDANGETLLQTEDEVEYYGKENGG
jgi:hypothetical protein